MRNGDQYLSVAVQHYATEKGFTQYTPIQLMAFKFNHETEDDLILMAETGGGKTEAATFSICSKVDFTKPGVRVLYVSPYCSLINDQTGRFEEMGAFEELDFRVTKWHKDAKQSLKNSLVRKPEGVLLITPESIEAMFQHHPENVRRLFSSLDYVVVDEIHEFTGGKPRGVHLQSILHRLSEYCDKPFRFIGLSATIGGDPAEIKNFMGRPDKTKLLRDKSMRETELTIDFFSKEGGEIPHDEYFEEMAEDQMNDGYEKETITETPTNPSDIEHTEQFEKEEGEPENLEDVSIVDESTEHSTKQIQKVGKESSEPAESDKVKLPDELILTLKETTEGKNSLIFANSKPMVEELAVSLKGLVLDENTFAHTAAVSKDTREEIEHMAKYGLISPYRICCTTTMEHGIDFPTLDLICQIDSTSSVSSLIQRAGRSGRRGGKAVIHIFCTEEWNMIQSIACCNLLKANQIESPDRNVERWNVLLMQILSIVRAHQVADSDNEHNLTLDELIEKLTASFAFSFCTEEDIKAIIEHCLQTGLIKDFEGDLIIGDAGTALVGKMNSYTSFQTPVEYVVKCLDLPKPIGTLPTDAKVSEGKCFFLSARIWEVTGIDEQNIIYVKEAAKGKKPSFFSTPAPISREVEQEMQRICTCDEQYEFISDKCVPILSDKREQFAEYKTIGTLDTPYCVNGANLLCFFPFQGTRIYNTLKLLLDAEEDEYALKVNKSLPEFLSQCKDIIGNPPDIVPILLEQLETGELTPMEKLEKYLPVEYQARLEATLKYDMPGAIKFLKELTRESDKEYNQEIPEFQIASDVEENIPEELPGIANEETVVSPVCEDSHGSVRLEGKVLVHNVFVSEGDDDEGERERRMAQVSEAEDWIVRQAAEYGKTVEFINTASDLNSDVIRCNTPKGADSPLTESYTLEYIISLTEHHNRNGIIALAKEHSCDECLVLVHVNSIDRSFAEHIPVKPFIGGAFIFENENPAALTGDIAHEMLHTFGAWDLYADPRGQSAENADKIEKLYPEEIMLKSGPVDSATMSPLTAWRVGLTDQKEDWYDDLVPNCERTVL